MITPALVALFVSSAYSDLPAVGMATPAPMSKEGLDVIAAAFEGVTPAPGLGACIITVASSGNFNYFDLLWTVEMVGYLGPLPPTKETNPLKNDLGITNPKLVERIAKSFQSFAGEFQYSPNPVSYWDISAIKSRLHIASANKHCSETFSFSTPLISDEFAFVLVDRNRADQKGPQVENVVLQRSNGRWTAIASHGF